MAGDATSQTGILGLLATDGPLTLAEIASRLTLTHHAVSRAACALIVRGYVQRLERGVYEATLAGLQAVREGRKLTSGPRRAHGKGRPPNLDSARQRAWTAMRVAKRFTVADLAVAVRRVGDPDPSHNLGKYCRSLVEAGILVTGMFRADDGVPNSNGLKVYRLLRDVGHVAPMVRRQGRGVFVPETGEVLPCSSTT